MTSKQQLSENYQTVAKLAWLQSAWGFHSKTTADKKSSLALKFGITIISSSLMFSLLFFPCWFPVWEEEPFLFCTSSSLCCQRSIKWHWLRTLLFAHLHLCSQVTCAFWSVFLSVNTAAGNESFSIRPHFFSNFSSNFAFKKQSRAEYVQWLMKRRGENERLRALWFRKTRRLRRRRHHHHLPHPENGDFGLSSKILGIWQFAIFSLKRRSHTIQLRPEALPRNFANQTDSHVCVDHKFQPMNRKMKRISSTLPSSHNFHPRFLVSQKKASN